MSDFWTIPSTSSKNEHLQQQTEGGEFFAGTRKATPFFSGGVQAKLTTGTSDDPYEKEADAMADKVVQRKMMSPEAVKPAPFFKKNTNHVQRACDACEKEEQLKQQEEGEEETVQTKPIFESEEKPEVQRKCESCEEEEKVQAKAEPGHAVQLSAPLSIQKQEAPAPVTSGTAPQFIVEDTAVPSANQLRKTDFLARLNRETCSTVDEALAGTPFTSQACPYISSAFQRLTTRTPAEIETALKRYDPRLREAVTLQQFFEFIRQRIRNAVTGWLQTGDLSGLPPEIADRIPPGLQAAANAASRVTNLANSVRTGVSNLVSGAGNLLSGIGSIFFKPKAGDAVSTASPQAVTQQLGSGTKMQGRNRERMETAFGTDFSNVQMHTDGKAAEMAQHMNARAFTVGSHIAFGKNEYQPGSLAGDALMAHELAHVQQQKNANGRTMSKSAYADNRPFESEADNTAVGVVARLAGGKNKKFNELAKKGLPGLKSGLQLQRCGGGASWDRNVSAIAIELYTTTDLNEPAAEPGQAVISDFGSFAVRLNTHQFSPPTPASFTLTKVGDPSFRDVRRPSSRGVSRFMRPPKGSYIIEADVMTGIPENRRVQVRRPVEIIDSLSVLSSAQAPGDLRSQAGQTLQANLIGSESMAVVLRQNAVAAANVPADLVEAWNAAHAQAVLVEGSISSPEINAATNTAAKAALTSFYRRLRTEIAGRDVSVPQPQQGRGVYIPPRITNPFRTQQQTDASINTLARGGATSREWRGYLNTFYDVTNSLNRYIAERLEAAGLREAASELRIAGPINNHLRKLYRDHPDAKPVQAVFYPKLQTNLTNDAPAGAAPHYTLVGLAQRMYTYRTADGVWHLLDITRPDRPLETDESGGSATLPPRSLMTELDSAERFPEGILYWQFEGGAQSSTVMTHPWTLSEVLNLISGVLAVAGIMALIVGSGGTAAPALIPTICFVASGIIGAAGAAAHIHESSELGTLTTQTIVIDSIGIAANLLSAGAAGMGHIVKAAQASEAAWTGYRGLSALGSQAIYRPIQIAAMGADFASLAAFSSQTLEQINVINAMPEGDAKTLAMQRLVVQALLTGGMTLISIRGGMHDIRAGRTLYLDFTTINGVRTPVAHRIMPQADLLAHPRLGASRAEAEAYFQRPDVDAALADQFRGELSVALSTAGISESEIRSFVQRMRSATATEARQILQEFRNNRINVSVGGVSRSEGYDLTYFHTNPVDFHASVRQAFEAEGTIAHNGRLSRVEGNDISLYQLQVDGPGGVRVDAEVTIVYQDFATGSAIGAGTSAPGASQGPARNTVIWDAGAERWRVRIEVDQRLAPRDIGRAVGHELDEASDVVKRLHGSQGADIQQRIEALQRPGIFGSGGTMTSHDFATLREIDRLMQADRTASPQSGQALSIMLRDFGLTADPGQFRERFAKVVASGAIDPSRHTLLEAWATYDLAVARQSRIRNMSREDFIREYENGRAFDEGGTYRWYNVESERGAARQFFTDAELADHNLAFQRLAGASSTSSFKPYYDMLTGNGLATEAQVRTRLSELLATSRGRDLDFVRHQLKETYKANVISYLTDRPRLATAHAGRSFEEASHAEMLRISSSLNSSDKGSLAEAWYRTVFAPDATQHVRVTGASGTTRFPDLLDANGTLQDIKYIEGRLSAREIEQFDDYRRMLGSDISVQGESGASSMVRVRRVRYAFINPAGVEANAGWMHSTLTTSSGGITFEIFNSRGQRRIVNSLGVYDLNGTRVAGLEFLTDTTQLRGWLNP